MKRWTLSVVLATLAALVFAPAALADTWIVDNDFADCPNADTASIQDAVNRAAPGDTIRVCPGLYGEEVIVNKPALELRAHGGDQGARGRCFDDAPSPSDPSRDVIVAGGGFTLAANDVEIEHFVVQDADYGIDASPAFSGYEIRGNLLQQNGRGLNFRSSGAEESLVRHNCFRGNQRGIESELPGTLVNARVDDNSTFRNREGGMWATGEGQRIGLTIEHNSSLQDGGTVAGNASIRITNSTDSRVTYNEIIESAVGIRGDNGNVRLEVSRNRIRDVNFNGIIFQSQVPGGPPNVQLDVSHNHVLRSGANGIAFGSGVGTFDSLISHNQTDENGRTCLGLFRNCGNGIFVGRRTSGTGNRFEHNHARRNFRDGILSFGDSPADAPAGNFYLHNHMRHNIEFDARDDNRAGNVWEDNHCETDFPPGTICENGGP